MRNDTRVFKARVFGTRTGHTGRVEALFFEPGLAAADPRSPGFQEASCATCHSPAASFGSGTQVGRGIGAGG